MTPPASDDADRMAALEARIARLEGRRDGLSVFSVVLAGIAVFFAIIAVGFGSRAIDESKDNVAEARNRPEGTAGAQPAASSRPCQQAAGFPDSALVQDKGTKEATGATLTIEAGDSFFSPTCTTGLSSGTVTLTVHNTGQTLHNVSIPDRGIDEDVEAGETITVQVEVGSSPVQFVCRYHRTSGMVGAVVPAGG